MQAYSARADSARAAPGVLIGQTTLVASAPTNALIIRTAHPNFPLLRETIQALDIRPAQVLFEVTVAEITLGQGDEFCIDWEHVGGSTRTTFGDPVAADSAVSSGLLLRFLATQRRHPRGASRDRVAIQGARPLHPRAPGHEQPRGARPGGKSRPLRGVHAIGQ
jgi:hypothetical protein